MTQALLYSINAEHLVNILNGLKTIEVRKRDLPQWAKDKLARGEIVEGYGYCTKAEPYLNKDMGNWFLVRGIDYIGYPVLNGLVVVKFEVSGSEFIDMQKRKRRDVDTTTKLADGTIHRLVIDFVLEYKYDNPEGACLTDDELHLYGNGKDLYAHHFTNIQPIEPMELSNFYKQVPFFEIRDKEKYLFEFGKYAVRDKEKKDEERKLTKAPQSFQSVWVKNNEKGEKS